MYSSLYCCYSENTHTGGVALRNKSVEEIRRELEPKVGSSSGVKGVSLDDLLPTTEGGSSEEEEDSGDVEDILHDLDNEDAAVSVSGADSPSPAQEEEKIPVQLTRAERDRILSQENSLEVKQFLKQFEIGLVSEEVELREECRALMKKQRKIIQSEVMQAVLGERFVETENATDDYPYEIEKMSLKKLRKLFRTLREVDVLGRASTAAERQLMVQKYDPEEKSPLEQMREEYLQRATRTSYDYCVTEQDFEAVYQSR